MRTCIAIVLAAGCAGDGPEEAATRETAPFLALPCTGGAAGTPSCPINAVSLAELGEDGTFRFVAMPLGDAIYLNDATFVAGAGGLYVEDPVLVTWAAGATAGTPTTAFAGVLNIPPNAALPAGPPAALVGDAAMKISLRFSVLDAYRP